MNTSPNCWAITIGFMMDAPELVTEQEDKSLIIITREHNGLERESKNGSMIEEST